MESRPPLPGSAETLDTLALTFYEKPTASAQVLWASSAYSWRSKLVTLSMEVFRHMCNASRQLIQDARVDILITFVDKLRRPWRVFWSQVSHSKRLSAAIVAHQQLGLGSWLAAGAKRKPEVGRGAKGGGARGWPMGAEEQGAGKESEEQEPEMEWSEGKGTELN